IYVREYDAVAEFAGIVDLDIAEPEHPLKDRSRNRYVLNAAKRKILRRPRNEPAVKLKCRIGQRISRHPFSKMIKRRYQKHGQSYYRDHNERNRREQNADQGREHDGTESGRDIADLYEKKRRRYRKYDVLVIAVRVAFYAHDRFLFRFQPVAAFQAVNGFVAIIRSAAYTKHISAT